MGAKYFDAGKRLSLIYSISFFLAAGCSVAKNAPSDQALREEWARQWINASPRLPMQKAYDGFLAERAHSVRSDAFWKLSFEMVLERTSRPISGSQLLDLLGPPDRGMIEENETTLLYSFAQQIGGANKSRDAYFIIGKDGNLEKILWSGVKGGN